MSDLRLTKGKNNGIIGGVLYTTNASNTETVFDLTDTTVSMEIYDDSGDIKTTIAGVVDTPTSGQYTIKPDANDLDVLDHGQQYFYRVVAVNAAYPDGLVFDTNSDSRELTCTII